MRLILASASPRRAELLAAAGIDFDVAPSIVDETPRPREQPTDYVLRVAREKAAAASGNHPSDRPLLAADTVVVAGGLLLGKPAGEDDARSMLRLLSGSTHDVHTGVVLLLSGRAYAEVVTTRVRFRPLSEAEIDWYVASGEPQGKAGAYAIQGRAARFIDRIEGSWSNVVGLPVATVYALLKQAGVISCV
jgi:septum formation protein